MAYEERAECMQNDDGSYERNATPCTHSARQGYAGWTTLLRGLHSKVYAGSASPVGKLRLTHIVQVRHSHITVQAKPGIPSVSSPPATNLRRSTSRSAPSLEQPHPPGAEQQQGGRRFGSGNAGDTEADSDIGVCREATIALR